MRLGEAPWPRYRAATHSGRRANSAGAAVGEKVGFIGVGRMGSGMASRLLAAGHDVAVYDPSAAAVAAVTAPDPLDARTPVPLLPMMANHQKQNMRDHLSAVQEIVGASAQGDFAGVIKAASRIGYSVQMGQMCTHMGAGAPGFTEQALAFHRTADTIAVAAKANDSNGVMRALDATLQACTQCHSAFRQQVVDEATWTRLTRDGKPPEHVP